MSVPRRSSKHKPVNAPGQGQGEAGVTASAQERGSILVIEDDSQVRNFIRLALQNVGFQVVEADNGTQGIGIYRQAPKDLVITDMLLPVTSGLRVIQELTSEFPKVKVIAITGESQGPDYLSLAEQFGAIKTLKKPFGPDELVQAVENALASGS